MSCTLHLSCHPLLHHQKQKPFTPWIKIPVWILLKRSIQTTLTNFMPEIDHVDGIPCFWFFSIAGLLSMLMFHMHVGTILRKTFAKTGNHSYCDFSPDTSPILALSPVSNSMISHEIGIFHGHSKGIGYVFLPLNDLRPLKPLVSYLIVSFSFLVVLWFASIRHQYWSTPVTTFSSCTIQNLTTNLPYLKRLGYLARSLLT